MDGLKAVPFNGKQSWHSLLTLKPVHRLQVANDRYT